LQGQGERNHVLGLSNSQHNQPTVSDFPYLQQDPFPEDKEKDDDKVEEEEHGIRNQQVFCIGEGIILDDIYCPNIKRPKEHFHLEELFFNNVVNPADRSQAGWLFPHAEFYYCHACTLRMVKGIGTQDKHDNICANGNFLNWLLISFLKKLCGKTSATMFL